MSILYICDRCGKSSNDRDSIRIVSLCMESLARDTTYWTPIPKENSIRMLCDSCVSGVMSYITKQLPQVKP